jgi:hypothetical protein
MSRARAEQYRLLTPMTGGDDFSGPACGARPWRLPVAPCPRSHRSRHRIPVPVLCEICAGVFIMACSYKDGG